MISKIIYKSFLFWVIINTHLLPQIKDTILVFEDCYFLSDSSDERVAFTSILRVDSVITENKNQYDIFPKPLRNYDAILNSISYNKIFLFIPESRSKLVLEFLIDSSGGLNLLQRGIGLNSTIFDDSIINVFKKEKFSPAKINNSNISSTIKLYLSSDIVLEKYRKDENLAERVIEHLDSTGIPVNKKFVVEKALKPGEKWKRLAERDIAEGRYYLLVFGFIIRSVGIFDEQALTAKYGFEYKYEGCVYQTGANSYNEEVMKYLTKKNGVGWYERFLAEYKELGEKQIKKMNDK